MNKRKLDWDAANVAILFIIFVGFFLGFSIWRGSKFLIIFFSTFLAFWIWSFFICFDKVDLEIEGGN